MGAILYTNETMNDWDRILHGFPPSCRDVYYCPSYYRTWADHEAAEPMCLHVAKGGIDFLYPFFRKSIPAVTGSRKVFDIFSAYGYGGMIASVPASEVPGNCLVGVNRVVDDWCRQNGVIAEFVRQNPLFSGPQGPLRRAHNTTVRENVYRRYDNGAGITIASASARRNVRKARGHGLRAEVDADLSTAGSFNRLYAGTSRRIGMHPYYHFGSAYTAAVTRWMAGTARLLNIMLEESVIAAAMVFQSGPYSTYHLSGSEARWQKHYPNDLLLATLVEMAFTGPSSVLSFGGGLGCAPDDALFAFKQRFGNETRPVGVGKNIHDAETYRALCDDWARRYPHLRERYRNHFLKYRVTQ